MLSSSLKSGSVWLPLLFFICTAYKSSAQFSNRIWCFGDSAGIDFTVPNSPTLFTSSMDCRGSCCSIADSSGLLFYAHTQYLQYQTSNVRKGAVKNKLHLLMDSGDSLVGLAWYNEMVIVPMPGNASMFYIFHTGIYFTPGLYYSIIDMSQNGGLGKVVSKNNQLQSAPYFSTTAAIKHGNGRDWWVLFKPSGIGTLANNSFYEYLVTPAGVSGPFIYNTGDTTHTDLGQITINHSGTQIAYVDFNCIIAVLDFNRCTGVINNAATLSNAIPNAYTVSAEFSPNDSVLYISTTSDTSYIFQYDLTATNIAATKDTVAFFNGTRYGGGYLKLAPDNKIYWSRAFNYGTQYNYPYDSSMYFPENMNLSVINNPNALGALCNYTSLSFYLGGKRTYYGLPNNPDYNLGPLIGSPCDTLGLGLSEQTKRDSELKVFYHTSWQKAFVNATGLKGNTYHLQIVDAMGKIVYSIKGETQPPYFTKSVDCTGWSDGIYFVMLQTEKEKLSGKFIKQ